MLPSGMSLALQYPCHHTGMMYSWYAYGVPYYSVDPDGLVIGLVESDCPYHCPRYRSGHTYIETHRDRPYRER